jgi:pSer/pThr/pTyr-binding forkhead associated (FHA) protein
VVIPRLRLLVLESGGSDLPAGQVIEVSDGATLGRAERASLVLADPAVSAEHARFGLREGEWVVADLNSTNGTLLNQALVNGSAALAAGDVVGLGTVRLQVLAH